MELIKLNEAYTLTDNPENGWAVSGQVIKENNGAIRINFSASNNEHHVGSYNYSYMVDGNVSVNINCAENYYDALTEYGQTLTNQILETINN